MPVLPPAAPDCDVLICGLGPVGQLLATLLGARGVRTIAVDEAPAAHGLPRAATIDDEVLRILQSVGLDGPVLADAQVQAAVSYVTAAGRAVQIVQATEGSLGQPPLVSIHQPSLERTLVTALADRPSVELRWGTRMVALRRHADHVALDVRDVARPGAPPVTLRGRWLVACDGGRSPVRSALGIAFGGSTFAQRWLVVDAAVDRPLPRVPHPCFVGDPHRPLVSLPMSPGRHRWEWMLGPGEDEAPLLEPARVAALMAPWLDGAQAQVERALVYTFHSRTAARWREGRVLLAGDAAHLMPPFAGQGLASGARDVANLAWKLEAVLRGAPECLLDSYEAERRPHVTAMQRLAVTWGGVVQSTRPRAARLRDGAMRAVDGSALQRWAHRHVKPLPAYAAGAFAQRPHRLPFRRSVGALFPQPAVRTADGTPARLDDLLPDGWAALARDAPTARALRAAGLTVLVAGVDLHDEAGGLTRWLDRHDAAFVVLRPDRFVFACGAPDAVPAALGALASLLGAAALSPSGAAH